jgi:hypothetical protein
MLDLIIHDPFTANRDVDRLVVLARRHLLERLPLGIRG